jgi:hypothetical protein
MMTPEIDSAYEFVVVLADSGEYPSTIRTQAQDLHVLNVPASHNPSEDLVLTWREMQDDAWMTLHVTKTVTDTTKPSGTSFTYHTVNIPFGSDQVTFNSDYFTSDIQKLDFRLTSTKSSDNVAPEFRKGSFLQSILEVRGSTVINH